MKVTHLGGTGFLGSKIVNKLIERGHQVTVITRNPDHEAAMGPAGLHYMQGDILQLDKLEISDRFDVLLYTAMVPFKPGRISKRKFRALEILTRQYFQNTIAFARRLSCPLILTSGASFETKGDEVADESWPIARKGMAALGKCYDELISELKTDHPIPLIEMLPGQIYGNGGMFDQMTDRAKKGQIVILGGGKNYLPRIHVEDCADAFVLAIEKLPLGQRFIVCDDENVSVRDFMLYLGEVFGAKSVRHIPKPVLRWVIGKQVFHTLTMNTKVSNLRIKKELGWKPQYPTYREGLKSLSSCGMASSC